MTNKTTPEHEQTPADASDKAPVQGDDTNTSTAAADADETAGETDEDAAATTGETVLTVEDVTHSFGEVDVLEDVSLTLEAGTVTTLIGPNGSGKTTLLRIITEVLAPSQGTVSYQGPASERAVGYMPQQPDFRPGFTARETLGFYTSLVGGNPDALLERVGLGGAGDRNVEALSGGMRRLLGIAQATVGDPPVVVLDEPGSGLDPGVREQTFAIVRELADEGAAVVLSTHDLSLAEEFADSIVLLDSGSIRATGTPRAVAEAYEGDSLRDAFRTAISRDAGAVALVGESE
jgi:ABC-type multidrug transport system ATPase subunit